MFDVLNEWWTWPWISGFDHAMISVPLVETTVLLFGFGILVFTFTIVGMLFRAGARNE
ncbi:MAG: hypothetical protein KKG09_10845 [Verrucomicrobia bacterium]|nr:hypothetical protein [Verrucomicrobiota bacterium]MCG2680224.1 hypothetical protein [Kiritimatiellia bacterium]MBU4247683.1 hypothetical protein [Verrucomicrobiota bacterium]MBU4289811.1 hypothetical protein [Verrucomicrobiota bacterium]MBU4428046.1 hypothetical protein [Verrucomicrobiota bacterium]